jgi:hypothetical protein
MYVKHLLAFLQSFARSAAINNELEALLFIFSDMEQNSEDS